MQTRPSPLSKNSNDPKRVQRQFFDFFAFFRITKVFFLSFWDLVVLGLRNLNLKLDNEFLFLNWKFVFEQVSENCASFGTKDPIQSFLRGGGGDGGVSECQSRKKLSRKTDTHCLPNGGQKMASKQFILFWNKSKHPRMVAEQLLSVHRTRKRGQSISRGYFSVTQNYGDDFDQVQVTKIVGQELLEIGFVESSIFRKD